MKLRVESDGDRVPKDVYLIDEQGQRIATLEGANENAKFRWARTMARCVNAFADAFEIVKAEVKKEGK